MKVSAQCCVLGHVESVKKHFDRKKTLNNKKLLCGNVLKIGTLTNFQYQVNFQIIKLKKIHI